MYNMKPDEFKKLKDKVEHYLVFTKYPYEIRKHIYTTNSVEKVKACAYEINQLFRLRYLSQTQNF